MEKPPEKGGEEVAQNHGTTFVLRKKGQEEKISWTWKREPLQGYAHTIFLSYRRKILSDIKSVLIDVGGEKLLQQFVDGCFGHLLGFIGGTSCNKALHELISREIILSGARDNELWFRIGETNIRFAPAEYALVTGLCFGSSTFDPLKSHEMPPEGLFSRLCSGRPISIIELWSMFNQQHLHGSSEDYLKVAHVLALNMMALGYTQRKRVEGWMWALVDDLDAWNRFPWGAYTYQALVHCISILPSKRADIRQYHFRGPVWALQIWAYEAIPRLGKISALVTRKVTFPRCLNWSFPRRNRKFPKRILERKLDCFVKLEPTDKEKRQPYWLSVQTEQPLGVPYAYGQSRKQGRQGAVHRRGVATAASLPRPRPRRSSIRTPIVESSLGEPESPVYAPDTDDSVLNAQFDQLSSRLVDRLIEPMVKKLIPHVNQKIEDLFQATEVDNQFATRNPGYNADCAKADEKKEQSFYGGSSSMHTLRHEKVDEDDFGNEEHYEVHMNDPRLDTGVANRGDFAIPNEESRSKRDGPIHVRAQRDSTEPKAEMRPPRAGEAEEPELLADPCSSKRKKKKKSSRTSKRRRLSPSSDEEKSNDDEEGSESSSGNERLAGPSSSKAKKKKKKKKSSSRSKRTRRSPSSDEETSNDDEESESSSGDERLAHPSSRNTKRKKSSSRSKCKRQSPSSNEESSDDERSESSSGNEKLANPSSSKAKKKKKKKNKSSSRSKRGQQSPSPDEETSDDEGSASSSGDERRRKMKKRAKRKKQKRSESSSSENSDNDKHRTKKKKLKRRRAS